MSTKGKSITFKATISPLVSAIKITGDDSGMRILLDVSESELANALGVLTMRSSVLEITIVDIGKMPIKSNGHKNQSGIDDILDMMKHDD